MRTTVPLLLLALLLLGCPRTPQPLTPGPPPEYETPRGYDLEYDTEQ